MSLLLSDIHLPALITNTLSEHSQCKSIPTWNNFDQLSCLWGVFTKYKENIRDGFRLENLSWRLWYRQSVLQKKVDPQTSEDIDIFTSSTEEKKSLTRTRSLPDLSQWSHQKSKLQNNSSSPASGSMTPSKQKFSIEEEEEETESEFEFEYYEEEEEDEDEDDDMPMTFTKKLSATTYKPVSLLSDMLQETTTAIIENNSGLRRCQSRYSRLDQYFLNSVSTA